MLPSKLPAAATRLVELLKTRVDLSKVAVADGPEKSQPKPTLITVGWSTANRAAYQTGHTHTGMRGGNDTEAWTIHGMIQAISGSLTGDAVQQARQNAADALDVLHDLLGDDMSLNGTCDKAVMGDVEWYIAVIPEKGVEFQLEWDIKGWGLL